jgi:hypothetical protein
LQRIASATEWLSIEINVIEQQLKSRTFGINPGQQNIMWIGGMVGDLSSGT